MAGSLRVDLERLRALSPELARIAESAQAELNELEASLAAEGECWGDDEPGRMFGDSYEPELDNGLTSFRIVIENLGRIGTGIDEAADIFQQREQDSARWIQEQDPSGTSPDHPSTPVPEQQLPSRPAPDMTTRPTGYPYPTPESSTAPSPGPMAGELPWYPAPGTPLPLTPGPVPATPPIPGSGTPADTSWQPGDSTAGAEQAAGPAVPGVPGALPAGTAPTPAGPERPNSPTAPRTTTTAGPSAANPATPWSRPTGLTGRAGAAPPVTPWRPGGPPAPAPRGQVFSPGTASPPAPPARNAASPPRDAKDRRKKPVPAPPPAQGTPVTTDPAALEAARALAERHGLRLSGFETSGIGLATVVQIAAAIDDIAGKYPLPELGALEIADLAPGEVSAVRWDEPRAGAAAESARIVLRRNDFADPETIAAGLRAATRSGRIAPGSDLRPVYATLVHDLGRVLAEAAGEPTRRLAEQALITEYHRISGPWHRGDTLASVVRGYRRWRAELSGACFTKGRLDSRAALADGFAEVELRGADACGPAKVLHRLVAERARGRSNP
ncbi:WXG100 family type VII secretion target [Nocardia sp. X0981]